MNIKHLLLSGYVSVTLLGCGGGGGGTTTPPETPPPATSTGYFVDSAVAGLNYTSGSTSGITDESGQFTYEIGKSVTFSVGAITLGTAPSGKTKITPVDIVVGAEDTTNQTVVNIARLLQTMDDDGDHSNGIQITPATREAVATLTVDFAVDDAEFTANEQVAEVVTAINTVTTADTSALVDSETAQTQLVENVDLKFLTTDVDNSYFYITSETVADEFYIYKLDDDNTGTLINDKTIPDNAGESSAVTWVIDTNGKLVLTTSFLEDTLSPIALADNVYTISGHMTDDGVVSNDDERLTAIRAIPATIAMLQSQTITIDIPLADDDPVTKFVLTFDASGQAGTTQEFDINSDPLLSGTLTSSISTNGSILIRIVDSIGPTDFEIILLSSDTLVLIVDTENGALPVDVINKTTYTLTAPTAPIQGTNFVKAGLNNSYLYLSSPIEPELFDLYQLNADATATLVSPDTNSGQPTDASWDVDENGKLVLSTSFLKDTLTILSSEGNTINISGHITDNGTVTLEEKRLNGTLALTATLSDLQSKTVSVDIPAEDGGPLDKVNLVFNATGQAGNFAEFLGGTANGITGTFTASINSTGGLSISLSDETDMDLVLLSTTELVLIGNDLTQSASIDFLYKTTYSVQ